MLSFARNGEDVVLARALGETSEGFYVDIGAGPPDEGSVTRYFSSLGWQGIDVSPSPLRAAQLRAARPRDTVIEAAVSALATSVPCFFVPGRPSTFTCSPEVAEEYRYEGLEVESSMVRALHPAEILAGALSGIDFLRVDAEGKEEEVISGLDLSKLRPRVILVVATAPGGIVPSEDRFEAEILSARYVRCSNDGINCYYVREEDAALAPLLVPANANDDFLSPKAQALIDEVARLKHRNGELARLLATARAKTQSAERRVEELESGGTARNQAGTARARLAAFAPVVTLDRLAVVSTPSSGEHLLSALLANALGVVEIGVEHPADLQFDELPERSVIEGAWKRSDHLYTLLSSHGFRAVTIARHPFDVVLAQLRLGFPEAVGSRSPERAGPPPEMDPLGPSFLDWASGDGARELLAVSASWWQDPATLHVRYDDLAADPGGVAAEVFDLAGFSNGLAVAKLSSSPGSPVDDLGQGVAKGEPAWRKYLTASVAEVLGQMYAPTLSALGFGEDLDLKGLPDADEARSAWAALVQI